MIYRVYALRDQAAQQFLAPILNSTDEAAIRDLANMVSQQDRSNLVFQPKDFDLYYIGDFDAASGLLVPASPIRLVVNAAALVTHD